MSEQPDVNQVVDMKMRCMTCGTAAYQPFARCKAHISLWDAYQTEQTMHAAWRKRAEEAETRGADLTAEVERLQQEKAEAMCVLGPSIPESGLVDACRQVKQVAISEADNAEKALAKLEAVEQALAEERMVREAAEQAEMRYLKDCMLAEQARDALKAYVQHKKSCAIYVWSLQRQQFEATSAKDCTCGLREIVEPQ